MVLWVDRRVNKLSNEVQHVYEPGGCCRGNDDEGYWVGLSSDNMRGAARRSLIYILG